MTIMNKPRVRIITGNEMNFRIGLMVMFSNPSAAPARAYSLIPPVKPNPATNQEAAYKATELPNILTKKAIIFSLYLSILMIKFQTLAVTSPVIRYGETMSFKINTD